jgi:hypothetical protein
MESGWDPEVKKYFKKILNSISFGLLWMMAMVTAGFYFQLAYADGKPLIYTILFYIALLGSLTILLIYYYRTWRK